MTTLRTPSLPTLAGVGPITVEHMAEIIREVLRWGRELQNSTILVRLTGSFAIDSTGLKTITINNIFGYRVTADMCLVSVVEDTAVDDWAYDLLKVSAADQTSVTVKINVSTASATGGATAKVVVFIHP